MRSRWPVLWDTPGGLPWSQRPGCRVWRVSTLPLSYIPRALATRDTRGLVKLIAEAESDRLLGAHILAAEAGEVIQTAAT